MIARRIAAGLAAVSLCTALGVVAASAGAAGQTPAAPTFTKDVAPILFKNCTGCHRPGEIAPMSLLTYEDARPYAIAIKDEVAAGHMPPWHADQPRGTFLNDRRLTDAEKQTLARWADAGAPRGDERDLPPAPKYTEGWAIGTPDVVFSMAEPYDVPAKGTIEYQYFEIPTNFTEDQWIQSIEVRPGARAVVHHVLVYAREPDGAPARTRVLVPPALLAAGAGRGANAGAAAGAGGAGARGDAVSRGQTPPQTPPAQPRPAQPAPRRLGALVASMAPGWNATTFQPGSALQLRAGAVLTFQMHYTANGTAASDKTSVGIVFAKTPPKHEVRAGSFVNTRLLIPAGAKDHQVDAAIGFAEDAVVWGLLPHTHLRGVKWTYRLVHPDGRVEPILSVPQYDFNWQTFYLFAKPLEVLRGSRIESSAWYDNSTSNPANPDPKSDVRWGDQTWEEMQYTGILYSAKAAATGPGGSR